MTFQAPVFVSPLPQPPVVSVAIVAVLIDHIIVALQAVNKSSTI